MEELFKQIDSAAKGGAYYLALYASLTVPDICSAVESADGEATRSKYIAWFDKYVGNRYMAAGTPTMTGEACYFYRCSMLHQGRAQHPRLAFKRIIFIEPGATSNVFHNNVLNDVLNIDIQEFCTDITSGARVWYATAQGTADFQRNYGAFMRRYPTGFPPYIAGVPVIA